MDAKGEGGVGMNWETGVDRYTLLCVRQITHENWPCSTGNSAQRSVWPQQEGHPNNMGWMRSIHFAEEQRLIQHRKATTSWFLKSQYISDDVLMSLKRSDAQVWCRQSGHMTTCRDTSSLSSCRWQCANHLDQRLSFWGSNPRNGFTFDPSAAKPLTI